MTTTVAAPVQTASTSHRFGIGVSVVAAVHLVLWGVVMAGGWLYWDDFILQGQAARLGLSQDLLLNNHDGHVMPLTYLVVWAIQELGGLDYGLVAATMLLGEVVLVVAAAWAFTTLLGRGWQTVVALAVFLLSPIMLPGLTWWSAALTLVPLMSCALFATVSHVRYLRTGSPAALITTFSLVAVSLGFFEKSLLIPLWLFLVSVLVERHPQFRRAVRASVRAHWRMWLGWLGLLAVYLVAFAQVAEGRTRLPTGPGQVVELISRALFKTIAPGLVGGPVRWTPVDFSASFADPPPWVVLLGAVAGLAVVGAGIRRPGTARKAWLVAAIYLAADLATFAVGRLGPTGDPAVVQAGRYVATAMIPISIAIGATLAQYRATLAGPGKRWWAVAAAMLCGFLLLISSLSYAAIWSKNPAQTWVGRARVDLAAADQQTPLLDQDVPDFLLLPVTHPFNQASWFLAPLTDRPGFAASTDMLQILDNRGRLVPARIDGASSLPPAGRCYQVSAGASATIPLEHALISWSHTVAVDYVADTPGFVTVRIGFGEPVAADVTAGRHELFVRAEGGDSTVTVTSTDAEVCVAGVQVGKVVPTDLPYRGKVDMTEQLQDLDQ